MYKIKTKLAVYCLAYFLPVRMSETGVSSQIIHICILNYYKCEIFTYGYSLQIFDMLVAYSIKYVWKILIKKSILIIYRTKEYSLTEPSIALQVLLPKELENHTIKTNIHHFLI